VPKTEIFYSPGEKAVDHGTRRIGALRESEEYDTDQKPERERAGNIGEW
jgi:hypothetical protein